MNTANNSKQANDAEVHEHIAFSAEMDDGEETTAIVADESDTVEEPMALIADNDKLDIVDDKYDGKYHNFDDVLNSDEMDIHLIYYGWLADSAATTHITHQRDAFITYELIPEVPISSVGGLKMCAIG